jgi:DNA mismatch repair protein MutL
MSDVIHLLPDSIANQIAAGEVIQRPASVVKELVENAIDAEATKIQIIVKDAGRTSIQVIDNGKGMSETDARMAFERHATSKIKTASDLFNLRTMGFRGEALPSIASISHVELKTRQAEKDTGVLLELQGEVVRQEVVSCPKGTSFMVKNLFYNVPARRKFLKSNNTESRHILNEVNRVALAHPQIAFTFIHGETEIYNLPESNLKQRIVNIFGKK